MKLIGIIKILLAPHDNIKSAFNMCGKNATHKFIQVIKFTEIVWNEISK